MKITQYWEVKLTMGSRADADYLCHTFSVLQMNSSTFIDKCIEVQLFLYAFFALKHFLFFLKSSAAVYC